MERTIARLMLALVVVTTSELIAARTNDTEQLASKIAVGRSSGIRKDNGSDLSAIVGRGTGSGLNIRASVGVESAGDSSGAGLDEGVDSRSTLLAKLASSGSGQKEIVWDPGYDWQRITYSCDVELELDVVNSGRRGDILQYVILQLRGTIRFWGTAEDHYYDSHDTWNFDYRHNYTIENPPSGLLEYSESKGRVTYVQSSLGSSTGDPGPYFIRFFGLAHPHSACIWVDLPGKWYFDDAYYNCNPGMGVDLTDSVMVSPRADVRYDQAKFQYNSAYPGNWRAVAPGAYLEASFEIENSPGSARLVIDHLGSADPGCSGGGYSPVDIIVNGRTIEARYDPAEHHGGIHDFAADEWDVGAYLQAGRNSIRVQVCDGMCSHYWIRYLYIDKLGEDCATCTLGVPKLFALVIGVDDPGLHSKKGSLDAQCVFDTLKSVPPSRDLVWASSSDGNPQEPVFLQSSSSSGTESLIAQKLDPMRIQSEDTFVFYISAHGGTPIATNDETPVQVVMPCTQNPTGYCVVSDSNAELLKTGWDASASSHDFISDDSLPALFSDPKWDNVRKIFIIQACRSGGFMGTSDLDSGDLETLNNCLLLASAYEWTNSVYCGANSGPSCPEGRGLWTLRLCPVLWDYNWEELRLYMLAVKAELDAKYGQRVLFPADNFYDPNTLIPFEFHPSFSATDDFDTMEGLGGAGMGRGLCDFSNDDRIDFTDYVYLARSWRQDKPAFDIAPIPFGDGIVDIADLYCLTEHWLEGTGP